jgi:flagellar hook-length control protein FliK
VGINATPPPTAASMLSKTPNAAASKTATPAGSTVVWPPQKLPPGPIITAVEPAKSPTPPTPAPAVALKGAPVPLSNAAPPAASASTSQASAAPQAARARKSAPATRSSSRIPASKSASVPTDTGVPGGSPAETVPTTDARDSSETSESAAADHGVPGMEIAAGPGSEPESTAPVTAPPAAAVTPAASGTTTATQDINSPANLDVDGGTASATAATSPVASPQTFTVAAAATAQATGTRSSGDATASPGPAQSSGLALNPTSVAHPAAEATAVTETVQTHTAVGSSGWADEVGTHVVWMAHQGVTSASLRLQPEELGPLEVRISVHESAVSVWFGAREPATRSALEQALPQLKEMFSAQGFNLTDAGVSREPPRGALYSTRTPTTAASDTLTQDANGAATTPVPRGLIDTYA